MSSYSKTLATKFLLMILFLNSGLFLFLFSFNFSIFKPLLIDESITAWLVSLDYQGLVREVFLNQGSSPAYFYIIKIWSDLISNISPTALKLFSVLLFFITLGFLYRLLRIHFSLLITVIVLGMIIGIKSQFALAILPIRPYSLVATFLAIGSYYYLKSLQNNTGVERSLSELKICFVTFFLATVCHYFFMAFWMMTLAHYYFYNFRSSEGKRILLFNFVLLLLMCLFIPHYLEIINNSSSWAQTLESDQSLFFPQLIFFKTLPISLTVLFLIVIGMTIKEITISTLFFKLKKLIKKPSQLITFSGLIFLGLPLIYYLLKEILGLQVYVYRYYFWYIIFGGIFVALLLRLVEKRSEILLLCCGLIFSSELVWNEKINSYRLPNFAEAAKIINQLNQPELPILFNPGLVESYDPKLYLDPQKAAYFFSYLRVYPISNQRRYLLPPNLDNKIYADYFSQQISPIINSKKDFLIYTSAIATSPKRQALPIPEFYFRYFEDRGWKLEILNNDPGVAVIHLKKPQ